jgi:O-antigen ligase
VALAAAVPISLLLARSGAAERLASDPVDQTRLAALGPMLQAARAFMPFGAGFGTFDAVYRRFEPDALLSTIYLNQAHNEPMQLAIEGGVPALVLLALFIIWWLRASVRVVSRTGSASRRALGMAMAATTLILMLSSLVDYPLRTPLLSGLFAIACVELLRAKRRVEAVPST